MTSITIEVTDEQYDRFWAMKNEADPESGSSIDHPEAFETMLSLWEADAGAADVPGTKAKEAAARATNYSERTDGSEPALSHLERLENESAEAVETHSEGSGPGEIHDTVINLMARLYLADWALYRGEVR